MSRPTITQDAPGGNLFAGSSTSPPELHPALRRLIAAVKSGGVVRVADVEVVRELVR